MVAQPRRGAGGGCRHLEGGGQDAALALAGLAAAARLAFAARLAGRTCAGAARRSGAVALS
ncbi:hypothetical protein EBL89_22455 (plasmid) [Cereibacter sphaeroides]|nr:hypothetical protein EBL89_22455 [Cereibacter sphaeroides]AZB62178.1 hypothetical protein EBL88_21805 [Cereibacter sphaeroides]